MTDLRSRFAALCLAARGKKMKFRSLVILTAFGASVFASNSSSASPLDTGSWFHAARIAADGGGMFDGNGNLQSTYGFGIYTSTLQNTDFERPFAVIPGMQILFITGDETIWGVTSYASLRVAIDAQANDFQPNVIFQSRINGVEGQTIGNVLSRNGATEDPWISLQGDHNYGVANSLIIWGETNFQGAHALLKNTHGGVNVFVSLETTATPIPAALPLFATGLGAIGLMTWRRKRKATA